MQQLDLFQPDQILDSYLQKTVQKILLELWDSMAIWDLVRQLSSENLC